MDDAASLVTCFARDGLNGIAEYERGLRARAAQALRRSADYGRTRSEEVSTHA
jgi:hypothetical protein